MYKVLLVDDEKIIRKGLLTIIDWKSLDCEVIDNVGNGIDALKIISEKNIDIVISDIRMPGLTGIDLSKKIYENKLNIKIILLTGYSDFQYAQQAIQYNVIDFILKPTSTEKIIDGIEKAKQALLISKDTESKIKTLEEKFLFNKEKIQKTILSNIFNGLIENSEIISSLTDLDINLSTYCILTAELENKDNDESTIDSLLDIFEMIFNNTENYMIILNNYKLSILINIKNTKEYSYDIENLCTETITVLKNFKSSIVNFGISSYYKDSLNLHTAFKESEEALSFSFFNNDLNIFFANKLNFTDITSNSIHNYVNSIVSHINNRELTKVIESIDTAFEHFKINQCNISQIKHICIILCSKCSDLLLNNNISFIELINNENIFSDILHCRSINKLKKLIISIVNLSVDSLNNNCQETNSIVDKAKNYILKNYNDSNLTLNSIASNVHVSNAYLSRLFKEKTGETISELIIKIRINKSKELLRSTNMKIYEIAYSIGIDDPAYFSQLFKKTTGLSPKEYKYNN